MRTVPYDPAFATDWLSLLNLSRIVPLTADEFARRDALWPAEDLRLRFLGTEKTGVAAIGQISVAPYAPGDDVACLVVTDPARRSEGFGTAMLIRLEDEVRASGYTALTATLPEGATDSRLWAKNRGFLRHATRFDSLLDLSHACLETGMPVPDGLEGITFGDMAEAGEADWAVLVATLRLLLADAPDMQGLPRWSEARCMTVLRDSPAARPRWIIVAHAGDEMVGLTVGQAMGTDVYSYFTGVRREWRGKRLGKTLKLRLNAAARSDGFTRMRTTNLDSNLPALRPTKRPADRPQRQAGAPEIGKPISFIGREMRIP